MTRTRAGLNGAGQKTTRRPRFRARAGGDSFSYCPLHGAVHLVHVKKPSLENGLVLVRYRELARLPPCKSIEDCPGIAASVSEVLGRS